MTEPVGTSRSTSPFDLLDEAWGIIANAGGGDWTRETDDWQTAAARWRDAYHEWLADPYRRNTEGAPK